MPVTVPGTGGSSVTISAGTGDTLQYAQVISNALSAASASGALSETTQSVSGSTSIPGTTSTPGTTTEVILTGSGNATVGAGYDYTVVAGNAPMTGRG